MRLCSIRKFLGLMILGSLSISSCGRPIIYRDPACYRRPIMSAPSVCYIPPAESVLEPRPPEQQPEIREKIPEREKLPPSTAPQPKVSPKDKEPAPPVEYQPEIPEQPEIQRGKMKRAPYKTKAKDLIVVPFTEMCLISPEAENKEEDKADWGSITPWLYKE